MTEQEKKCQRAYKLRIKGLQRNNQIQFDIIKKLVTKLMICAEQLPPKSLLKSDVWQELNLLHYYHPKF